MKKQIKAAKEVETERRNIIEKENEKEKEKGNTTEKEKMVTLYIEIRQVVQVTNPYVTIGSLGTCWCSDPAALKRCKALTLLQMTEKRKACSLLEVIQCIESRYPNINVTNLGEHEFIIEHVTVTVKPVWLEWIRFAGIWFVLWCGAAFAIATFNEDVSTAKLFEQIHGMLTNQPRTGITWLEIGYAIGVGSGILLFYNHISKKKSMSDPTPLEVEMRTYEKDVYHTLLENASRTKYKRH